MSNDSGMATVEYAIVVLAAAALGTALLMVTSGDWVVEQVQGMLQRAFAAGT